MSPTDMPRSGDLTLQTPADEQALERRYAAYAPVYDTQWAAYSEATLSAAIATLHRLANPTDRHLVDVACGTGLLASKIADAFPQLRVTGVDLSEPMLERARQRHPDHSRFRWLSGRAEILPVPDASADLITCTNAFHLVRDQAAAIREFRRVLRPGGRLLIVDWRRDTLRMRAVLAAIRLVPGPQRHVLTPDELRRILIEEHMVLGSAGAIRAGWIWDLMALTAARPSTAPVS